MHLLIKRSFACLFLFLAFTANAQLADPLKWWSTSQKQINDSEYSNIIHCEIPKLWHTYSQYTDSMGPIATVFTYTPSPEYRLEGKTEEATCISEYDSSFKCTVKYFIKPVDFTQKIVVHAHQGFNLKGNVYFQSCNNGQCLAPKEYDFSINIQPAVFKKKGSSGYLWIWLGCFGAGLLALLIRSLFGQRIAGNNEKYLPVLRTIPKTLVCLIMAGLFPLNPFTK
jgi:hypothetical protein